MARPIVVIIGRRRCRVISTGPMENDGTASVLVQDEVTLSTERIRLEVTW